MTLAQTAAARIAPSAPEVRGIRLDTVRRARTDRTARAREARLKLNGPRRSGDFSHLTRVYD